MIKSPGEWDIIVKKILEGMEKKKKRILLGEEINWLGRTATAYRFLLQALSSEANLGTPYL